MCDVRWDPTPSSEQTYLVEVKTILGHQRRTEHSRILDQCVKRPSTTHGLEPGPPLLTRDPLGKQDGT